MGRGGGERRRPSGRGAVPARPCSRVFRPKTPSLGRCFIKSSTFTGVLFAFSTFSLFSFLLQFAFVRAWVGRSACSSSSSFLFFRLQLAARRHGGGSLAVVAFRFRGVRAALGRRVDFACIREEDGEEPDGPESEGEEPDLPACPAVELLALWLSLVHVAGCLCARARGCCCFGERAFAGQTYLARSMDSWLSCGCPALACSWNLETIRLGREGGDMRRGRRRRKQPMYETTMKSAVSNSAVVLMRSSNVSSWLVLLAFVCASRSYGCCRSPARLVR